MESFSFAFPAIIICELLGIPGADRHAFRGWTDAIVSTATSTPEQLQDTYLHLAGYLAGLFAQRRAQPGNDLLTWLVQARDNDDRLTEAELLFLGMALLVGGYETTAHQITNMVYTLLSHGKRLRQLKDRPELLPNAVEELLRFIVFGSAHGTTCKAAGREGKTARQRPARSRRSARRRGRPPARTDNAGAVPA